MATYTSNLNLYMPDSTDDFGEFREEHNDNMVKIDNAIGGGGGSGGHTIIDQSGNAMPSRTGLQFIGASVTDDSVNNKTVVTVTGGGGGVHYSTSEQVIGTWTNNKPLYQRTYSLTGGIVIGSYGHISLPADSIVRGFDGYAYRNSHASVDKFNGFINSGDLYVSIRSGQIEYWISNIFNPVEEIEFTVQYTKVTD